MNSNINYILTRETANDICKYYGIDPNTLHDWEIEELTDRFIDEKLYGSV